MNVDGLNCFLNKIGDPVVDKLMKEITNINTLCIDYISKESEIKKVKAQLQKEYKRIMKSLSDKPFMKLIMEFVDFNEMLDKGYPFDYTGYYNDTEYSEVSDEAFGEIYKLNVINYEPITNKDMLELLKSNPKKDGLYYLDKKFIINNKYIIMSYILTEYADGEYRYQDFEIISLADLKKRFIDIKEKSIKALDTITSFEMVGCCTYIVQDGLVLTKDGLKYLKDVNK